MKNFIKNRTLYCFWLIIVIFGLGFYLSINAEEALPQAQLPVLVTSAGQCPQVQVVSVFATMAGLEFDLHPRPTVDMLEKGVGLGEDSGAKIGTDLEKYPIGNHYHTVFITMGASMKGMGAAGISADDENKRVEEVVKWFQEQKDMLMIGVHIAGEDRRYHYLSEGMIDRVAPYCNLLIIAKESDADGRFTEISNKYGLPMKLVDTEFDLLPVISELFNLEQ